MLEPSQVLLVEDDPQMQDVLVTLLAEDSVSLRCVRDGRTALETVLKNYFDLIVLDLGLPGAMDGFEILAQLKADPATQDIPVIILTAWNRTEDKLRGFELGACDYLTKPFEAAELRARLRAALRTHRLQEELTQTNRELITARLAAEANARNKAEFLATMSHEIRTPMNGVIAMSSLLLETPMNHEQRGYVETIHTCSESLLSIINEILDFSKIESGKLELELRPFDFRNLVENSLDLLAPKAAEKKIDLTYQIDDALPQQLLGDPTRLKQVLINLISNGIKFTGNGEVFVHVKIHTTPSAEKALKGGVWQVQISIRDTGIGIPADRMARLFKPFTQADASTARQFGGTGLGLAISKRLVDMMCGKMWVESVLEKGSTFHLILPLEALPPSDQVVPGQLPSALKSKRILIVDDNFTNCRILSTQLGKWNLQSRATQAPGQALDWLREGEKFDLAILDMHMPDIDGLKLACDIRKLPGGEILPIILLTSIGVRPDSPGFAEAAFASCLTKPVKPSQLLETLGRILSDDKTASAKASTPGKPTTQQQLAARMPLRILVCDDNQINLKVASRLLQQLGYKPDSTTNGREAVEAIERQPYDIVFMDVQMPEMDGLEATRIIRERQQSGDSFFKSPIIIVAITASVMQGDREKCTTAGMDDYLAKPVRPEDIRLILERWGDIAAKDNATNQSTMPETTEANSPRNGASNNEPPVDMERLLDFADNDMASLNELVQLYFKQTSGQLEQLAAAIQSANAPEVQRLAHSCAGASATCGMNRLAPILRELERQGHDRALNDSAKLFQSARAEFDLVQNTLNTYLASRRTPASPKA